MATIKMFSVSISLCSADLLFCLLDSTYKRHHLAFVSLCLTYFTQQLSSSCTRAAASGESTFLLRRVSLHGIRARLPYQPSLAGRFGCARILAVVTNAAVNMGMNTCLFDSMLCVSSGKHREVARRALLRLPLQFVLDSLFGLVQVLLPPVFSFVSSFMNVLPIPFLSVGTSSALT